jgi:translation elongation factor EF-G
MLVKQQQLGVFFFYTGKSHKIGEYTMVQQWTGCQEQERGITITSAANCSWNFPMRQEALPEELPYHFILILRDTLILLEGESFFTCT